MCAEGKKRAYISEMEENQQNAKSKKKRESEKEDSK